MSCRGASQGHDSVVIGDQASYGAFAAFDGAHWQKLATETPAGQAADKVGAHRPGHVSSGVPRSFMCRWQMYAVTIAKLVYVVKVNLRSTAGAAIDTSAHTCRRTRHTSWQVPGEHPEA